jgi:hypothetical protein
LAAFTVATTAATSAGSSAAFAAIGRTISAAAIQAIFFDILSSFRLSKQAGQQLYT